MELLYKILSYENMLASQNKNFIKLPAEDESFIHFSTKDQLEQIPDK